MVLWPDREADASADSTTPSKVPGEEKDERGRLEKVRWRSSALMLCRAQAHPSLPISLQIMEKQKRKDVPSIDWLDKLAFRQIEKVHAVSGLGGGAMLRLTSRAQTH